MRVTLRQKWFSPSESFTLENKVLSGHLYPAGEHEMPDWLFPHLPRSAKVMDGPDTFEGVKAAPTKKESFKDHDHDRRSAEEMDRYNRKALAAAKAREALALKRAMARVEKEKAEFIEPPFVDTLEVE